MYDVYAHIPHIYIYIYTRSFFHYIYTYKIIYTLYNYIIYTIYIYNILQHIYFLPGYLLAVTRRSPKKYIQKLGPRQRCEGGKNPGG